MAGASSLTSAELRLLPLLATHLSFRQIGETLFISSNTVKTEAISIYRKLGVSSRGDAIASARELGLLKEDHLHDPRSSLEDDARPSVMSLPYAEGEHSTRRPERGGPQRRPKRSSEDWRSRTRR
jgi:DNA-binding CsgD family transcriptional regulator